MEYAIGWVTKKVTSHQIGYCVAYHSVTIMVETRWLRSANFGFLMYAINGGMRRVFPTTSREGLRQAKDGTFLIDNEFWGPLNRKKGGMLRTPQATDLP